MTNYADQIERIRNAASLEEIQKIVLQYPAKAEGDGGILYSGKVDEVRSEMIAKALTEHTNQPLINNTPRAQFLTAAEDVIKNSAARIFEQQGQIPALAEKSAGDFLYGDGKVPSKSLTSVERCLWGEASREFSSSLRGDIKLIASNANVERVFGRVELPAVLDNPNVKTLGGQPVGELKTLYAQGGADAVLPKVQAQFIEAAPKGIFVSPEGIGAKTNHVTLSREFSVSLGLDAAKYTSAAELSASGKVVRAPIGMSAAMAADEAAIAARVSAALNASPSASFKPAAPEIQTAAARGLHPNLIKGAGLAGLALSAYDATDTYRTVNRLQGEGNHTASESQLIHFGSRSVGGLAGAGIGFAGGAALGVETGPGLLVTGAIGGVVGTFAGDKFAAWTDNRRIYNQPDGNGNTWTYDPEKPELSWQRKAPIDSSNDDVNNATKGYLRASPATANQLNYQATSTSVELVLGSPPIPRDPFVQGEWHRNTNGNWQRAVVQPFIERDNREPQYEGADVARTAALNQAAAQTILGNTANTQAVIAARYEDTYIRNGWSAYGEVPEAARNARMHTDKLIGSDGNRYQRRADGEWISEGMFYSSTAKDNLRDELDATRAVLQAKLPPPQSIPAPSPITEESRLRDTLQGAYNNAGITVTAEQLATNAVAVQKTWSIHGLDPNTTALQVQLDSTGRYSPHSPIASLRLEPDGVTYRAAAETTLENIQRTQKIDEMSPPSMRLPTNKSLELPEQGQTPAKHAALQNPTDPTHPDYAMLQQIRAGVRALDEKQGRAFDDSSERICRNLLATCKDGRDNYPDANGHWLASNALKQVDHVIMGNTGNIFAIEGDLQDPSHKRVFVSAQAAAQTPVEQSDQKLQLANQQISQEQELTRQASQQREQNNMSRAATMSV